MMNLIAPSVRDSFILEVGTAGQPARATAGKLMRTALYQCALGFIDAIPSFFAERGFSIRGGFSAGSARGYSISDGTSSVYLAYVRQEDGTAALALRAPGTSKWWIRAEHNSFQEQVHYDLVSAGAQPSAATRTLVQSDSRVSSARS
jgi:hypothetical protein